MAVPLSASDTPSPISISGTSPVEDAVRTDQAVGAVRPFILRSQTPDARNQALPAPVGQLLWRARLHPPG